MGRERETAPHFLGNKELTVSEMEDAVPSKAVKEFLTG